MQRIPHYNGWTGGHKYFHEMYEFLKHLGVIYLSNTSVWRDVLSEKSWTYEQIIVFLSCCLTEHMQIRLSGGGSPCAGRVEVYYDGSWGSVCDDSWDAANAHVACKQLGCGNALEVTLPDSCGAGSGPIWLDEIDCSGNETFLWDCPSAPWSKHDCSHKEDVRIMCSG